jgi:energy-converting hydrogenase A subunit M
MVLKTDDEYRRDLVVSKVNLLTKSMEEYINIFSDTIEIINLHDNY